jgi:hypothetical protein
MAGKSSFKKAYKMSVTVLDRERDRGEGPATEAPPGSRAKVREMEERARRGESLFVDGDLDSLDGVFLENTGDPEHPRARTGKVVNSDGVTIPLTTVTDLGSRLKTLRERAGLSRKAISLRARISDVYVCLLENGKREMPRGNVLWMLADALGVSLDELVGRTPPALKADKK